MSGEPVKLAIIMFLHRKCLRPHTNLGQLRECHGSYAQAGEDYVRISVEVEHPWPQDRTF